MTQARWFPPVLFGALVIALGFLTLPIVAIFVDTGPGELLASLDDPAAIDALTLSLWTSALAVFRSFDWPHGGSHASGHNTLNQVVGHIERGRALAGV